MILTYPQAAVQRLALAINIGTTIATRTRSFLWTAKRAVLLLYAYARSGAQVRTEPSAEQVGRLALRRAPGRCGTHRAHRAHLLPNTLIALRVWTGEPRV